MANGEEKDEGDMWAVICDVGCGKQTKRKKRSCNI